MGQKIGFIGLGLIGGSIARAIRQYFPDYEIVAFDKNKETLALATQESVIDVAATTIDDNFHQCSYIFLCAPVSYNTAYLKQVAGYLHEDCILTDVGSVKTNIHREVEALGQALGERGIAVRAGLHCAPLAHRSAGTLGSGTVRISFSDFNTPEEVSRMVSVVREILS